MDVLDLKGMSCPLPVIQTKRLVESSDATEVQLSLDQGPPRENVTRFLESRGYCVDIESETPDSVVLRATRAGKAQVTPTEIDVSSEHGEPGTRSRVREAGYPLAGAALPQEGATRAPVIVVLIDGTTVGRGDDQLGSVLMKSFLHTLKEVKPLPWRLIFLNAGVKLAANGSDLVTLLSEIQDLGVEILSCGTCLDFFKLKDKLAVGSITNMYEIVSSLVTATSVLRP